MTRVAFSHDGRFLASTSWDGRTILWSPNGGRLLASAFGTFTQFRRRDGALGFRVGTYETGVWRVAGGEEYRALHAPVLDDKGPHECDVSPDGRWAAAACGAGGARIWSTGRPEAACVLRAGTVVDVHFLRDSQALLTSGSLGLLRWPIGDGAAGEERTIGPPEHLGIRGDRFSVDGRARLLATVHPHHAVVYRLAEDRAFLGRFPHPNLSRLQLSASGRWLVTVTWHGRNVRVWDVESATLLREFECESARARFSPDERWLAIGTGPSYSVLDTATWAERWRIDREGAGDLPGPVAFSGDSRLVALAHARTHIDLHVLETGEEVARLEAPASLDGVTCAALADDGSWAAVGSDRETLHLWNLRAVRRQLADLGLDWEPPLAPPRREPALPRALCSDYGLRERFKSEGGVGRAIRDDSLIGAYTALIDLDPTVDAYLGRAAALRRRGLIHDALADVRAASELDPEDPSIRTLEAELEERLFGAAGGRPGKMSREPSTPR